MNKLPCYQSIVRLNNLKPTIHFSDLRFTMKSALSNFLFFMLVIFVSLLLCEGLLRLKNKDMKNYTIEMWRYAKEVKQRSDNPRIGHEHRPSVTATLQSVVIRTNRYGLRGKELDENYASKKRRILFLGSSGTLGWGVREEDTAVEIIGKSLGEDVAVLNAGIGNFNTSRYVELFLSKLSVLKPTDIVVNYYMKDAGLLDAGGGNWLLKHSELAVILWEIANQFKEENSHSAMLDAYHKLYQPDSRGFLEMTRALDRLAEYTHSHGIHVYFVLLPDLYDLKHYKYGFAHDIMKKQAEIRNFDTRDLLPFFQGENDVKKFWVMPTDRHPNSLAQNIMAQAILEMLQKPVEKQ